MPTTFKNIYEDAINRTGGDTSDTTLVTKIKGYVNDNYKMLANKYDWRWLYDKATIVTTPKYDTGTITTDGTTTIIGSGTIFTLAMVGRKFRAIGFDEIYTISAHVSATEITLDNDFNGDDIAAGGYEIFQDVVALPSDCDVIVSLEQHRHPIKLRCIGYREMRRLKPRPELQDSDPILYAHYEPDSSGYQQIILWPPPYRAVVLNLTHTLLITDLVADDSVPLIPEQYRQILKLMTITDIYGHERDDDRSTYYEQKVAMMINEMIGKYTTMDDYKTMTPETKRRQKVSLQELINRKYDLGETFDRY